MSDKYELSTIRDIFEKVPLHKIDECMSEITVLIKKCKTIEASMKGFAYATTGNADNAAATWPDPLVWIDDSKGEITTKLRVNGERITTFADSINSVK